MAQPDTAELTQASATERFRRQFFGPPGSPLEFEFGGATHVGRVRTENQDHFAVVERRRSQAVLLSDLPSDALPVADETAYSLVVVDGMGGARFGEFASRFALQTMFELTQRASSWVMKLHDLDAEQIRQRVEAYVGALQAAFRQRIEADPDLAGMGTTWTSAHLFPPLAIIVHVGDSRAYLMRGGTLRQVTRDETMAQALIDAGMDSHSVERFTHVLLNSFGGDGRRVAAQIHPLALEPDDLLLLCSDGLTGMVGDDALLRALQSAESPQAACDALVGMALAAGGRDNVTVVAARVGESPGAAATSAPANAEPPRPPAEG